MEPAMTSAALRQNSSWAM